LAARSPCCKPVRIARPKSGRIFFPSALQPCGAAWSPDFGWRRSGGVVHIPLGLADALGSHGTGSPPPPPPTSRGNLRPWPGTPPTVGRIQHRPRGRAPPIPSCCKTVKTEPRSSSATPRRAQRARNQSSSAQPGRVQLFHGRHPNVVCLPVRPYPAPLAPLTFVLLSFPLRLSRPVHRVRVSPGVSLPQPMGYPAPGQLPSGPGCAAEGVDDSSPFSLHRSRTWSCSLPSAQEIGCHCRHKSGFSPDRERTVVIKTCAKCFVPWALRPLPRRPLHRPPRAASFRAPAF